MAVAAPAQDLAKQLCETVPFNRMAASRRFQLLSQAKSFRLSKGQCLFPENEVPTEVFLIFHGNVCLYADMLAEEEPVLLEEQGPGACVGWIAALSGMSNLRAVATTEVRGLSVPAPAFLEITRYDPALREAVFSRAWKGEIWRAVLAEMERRTGRIVSAAQIVERIRKECIAREWPEEHEAIAAARDRAWIVVGGEGAIPGERWHGGDGVLWARLIGLPEPAFTSALLEPPATAARASVRSSAGGISRHLSESSSKPATPPSSTVSPQKRPPKRSGTLRRAMTMIAVAMIFSIVASVWASRQNITRRVSITGRLVFSGDSRTVTAGVSGVISEFHMREGERIQGGTLLAIIRPPLDEEAARKTSARIAQLEKDAAFCHAVIAGTPAGDAEVSAQLAELARRHAQLSSDLRVLHAISNGDQAAASLNANERARVAAHFTGIQRAKDERLSNMARDTSTRYDELREAENALRAAQAEVASHIQAFAGATTGDKKSAEQELRDYNRVLAVLNRNLAAHRETVNRIRREIASAGAEETQTAPQSAPGPELKAEILRTSEEIAALENQLASNIAALKSDITASREKLDQIREAAAPRQIKALQPGYIIEAAKLVPGTIVRSDTVLGRIITRNAWQIECGFPSLDTGRIEHGQELAITVADRYATLIYEHYAPVPGSATRVNLRDSRDDWRDGMAVRVETIIITGTLLDDWLETAGLKRR